MNNNNILLLFSNNAVIKGKRESVHGAHQAWLVASGKCYFNSTSGIKVGDELVAAKKDDTLYLMRKPEKWDGDVFTVGRKGALGVISIKHGLNISKNASVIASVNKGVFTFKA